jgi:hypothetical protein
MDLIPPRNIVYALLKNPSTYYKNYKTPEENYI